MNKVQSLYTGNQEILTLPALQFTYLSAGILMWKIEIQIHPPTMLSCVPSPDCLAATDTWTHLALTTHTKAG